VYIRNLNDCPEFVAGDETILRELLHPDKADLKLRYSLAHASVAQGNASVPHRLTSSEIYYILEGHGVMYIDNASSEVKAGDTVYIPPHATQWIENTGEGALKFLCIVDPAWRAEDEAVL